MPLVLILLTTNPCNFRISLESIFCSSFERISLYTILEFFEHVKFVYSLVQYCSVVKYPEFNPSSSLIIGLNDILIGKIVSDDNSTYL